MYIVQSVNFNEAELLEDVKPIKNEEPRMKGKLSDPASVLAPRFSSKLI